MGSKRLVVRLREEPNNDYSYFIFLAGHRLSNSTHCQLFLFSFMPTVHRCQTICQIVGCQTIALLGYIYIYIYIHNIYFFLVLVLAWARITLSVHRPSHNMIILSTRFQNAHPSISLTISNAQGPSPIPPLPPR